VAAVEQGGADDLTDKALQLARDALYVTVGAGVLTYAKIQLRRRELQAERERARRGDHDVK
jgi:hypothetical protein